MNTTLLRRAALVAATLALPAAADAQSGRDAVATRADSATARPVRRSWTSDRHEYSVGDIITVVVDEYAEASAHKGNTATDTKRRTMEAGADLPIEVDPTIGRRPRVSIGSSNNGESRQRGEATRGSSFEGEIAVRVVAVKDGMLQIRGQKLVDVDKNKQQLSVSGWVSPDDVSAKDVVMSSRIADAQIVYQQKGKLGKPKTGLVTRILGVFWP